MIKAALTVEDAKAGMRSLAPQTDGSKPYRSQGRSC